MPESQNLGQANKNNTNVWTLNSNAYKIIVWSRCFSNVSASSDLLQSHKCVIYTYIISDGYRCRSAVLDSLL